MNARMRTVAIIATWAVLFGSTARSQQHNGDITVGLQFMGTAYTGEFVGGGLTGGASMTLGYGLTDNVWTEARVGFGGYAWQNDPSLLRKYDDYFGASATYGATYPGSSAQIESMNQSSLRVIDLLLNYSISHYRGMTPFVAAGVGMTMFQPRTSTTNDPLPNYAQGAYASTALTFPLGIGLRYQVSDALALALRAEYRVVLSGYLDDYAVKGVHDGLYTVSAGLAYTFGGRSAADQMSDASLCDDCLRRYDALQCVTCATRSCPTCSLVSRLQAVENIGDDYGDLNQSVGSRRIAEADSEEAVSDADSQSDSVLGSGVSPQAAEDAAPQQPAPASPKRKLTVNGIRFGVDSEQINMDDPATRTNMNEMLEYLRESCQELRVLIGGHASSDGPEPRNQELSVLRARQVAAWLVEQGVPEEKIQGAIGYGSSMPKIAEPTPAVASRMTKEQLEAIREQNRRIELEILEDCK